MTYGSATQAAQGKPLRLLTVSNRGPQEFHRSEDGKVRAVPGQGGLSTALTSAAAIHPMTWLSSPLTPTDREIAERKVATACAEGVSHFVPADPEAYELFYGCFANEVLWFLQHNLPWPEDVTPERRVHAWHKGYAAVNQAFADTIVDELDTGAYHAVMFHDYHFYLAPRLVREQRDDIYMQHFVHIPWPAPEEWIRLEPDFLEAICEGLLANDSVVFQTPDGVRNFIDTCDMFLPEAAIDRAAGTVTFGSRVTRVWSNGISVDPAELEGAAASPEFSRYRYLLRGDPGQKTIVRVDRMDPTKNVVAGFHAYAQMLEAHPELQRKVQFIAHLFPSRSDIPMYREYQEEVHSLVDSINHRFGSVQWKPIRLRVEHNRVQALAAMSLYDVLLVNPVADGMNLVAKEGPMLNRQDGVLVLSRTAGAHAELGCGSLSIEPRDVDATAEALYQALTMPAEERHERALRIRQRLLQHDLRDWFEILLADIEKDGRAPSNPQRSLVS